jgi:hypothetical protein
MLKDDHPPYRWQDRVITAQRAAANLAATALIMLAIAIAGLLGSRTPATTPGIAVASERTPSLAEIAKRPAVPHAAPEALGGC